MNPAVIDRLSQDILSFLHCPTPAAWVDAALNNQDLLLIDHANCEKKAASAAMAMMYKYIDREALLTKMSKLAREELVHFDQVRKQMQQRSVAYVPVSASRYATALHQRVRKEEPQQLVDRCIVGAIVEARSCERFAALVPHLDDSLADFYFSLLRSESRHFRDYLALAQSYSPTVITARLEEFLRVERELIETGDEQFRFHSGVPA